MQKFRTKIVTEAQQKSHILFWTARSSETTQNHHSHYRNGFSGSYHDPRPIWHCRTRNSLSIYMGLTILFLEPNLVRFSEKNETKWFGYSDILALYPCTVHTCYSDTYSVFIRCRFGVFPHIFQPCSTDLFTSDVGITDQNGSYTSYRNRLSVLPYHNLMEIHRGAGGGGSLSFPVIACAMQNISRLN